MIDIEAKAKQVYEQGFCVLESVYDSDEIKETHRLLDGYWHQQGSPTMSGFGIGIHPLAEKVPAIMPFYGRQIIVDVMKAVLRDEVHLVHVGARLSNEDSESAIWWHNHYAWDSSKITQRDTIERILAGVYTNGSNEEAGNLIAVPRAYNDPINEPLGDSQADWPGQVKVEAPPGSVVIFDTALWHTARRGTEPGIRHLFGAHYQGWSNPTSHPEDNNCNGPEIKTYKRENAALRSLLDAPATALKASSKAKR